MRSRHDFLEQISSLQPFSLLHNQSTSFLYYITLFHHVIVTEGK